MKTDLFNYICNKVFFQLDKNRLLYFITFFFKNLNFNNAIIRFILKKCLPLFVILNNKNLNLKIQKFQ